MASSGPILGPRHRRNSSIHSQSVFGPSEIGVLPCDRLSVSSRQRASSTPNKQNKKEDDQSIYSDSTRIFYESSKGLDWDVFRMVPHDDVTAHSTPMIDFIKQLARLLVFIICFIMVIGGAVVSRACIQIMSSQLLPNTLSTQPYCTNSSSLPLSISSTRLPSSLSRWWWCLLILISVPNLLTFLRSLRIVLFNSIPSPTTQMFLWLLVTHSLHTLGVTLLVFQVLPTLDVIRGVMIMPAVLTVPSLLLLLSRTFHDRCAGAKLLLDILSLIAQSSALVYWLVFVDNSLDLWPLPVSLLLISAPYWENYVDRSSCLPFISMLATAVEKGRRSRVKAMILISLWKILLAFLLTLLWSHTHNLVDVVLHPDPLSAKYLIQCPPHISEVACQKLRHEIGARWVNVTDDDDDDGGQAMNMSSWHMEQTGPYTYPYDALIMLVSAAFGSFMMFTGGSFACRVNMQRFSFAFPALLSTPLTVGLFILAGQVSSSRPCLLASILPG